MALLNLFGKKKKEFKASCTITKDPLEKGYGYLLTTAQVVSSRKYWDLIMTEPETLSYTVSHFKNQSSGTHMRSMIFEKYATVSKPWIVSDSVINYFDVNRIVAREGAQKWRQSEGNYVPEQSGTAIDHPVMPTHQIMNNYAILQA